jgi:sugar lactone lactonase YvrE
MGSLRVAALGVLLLCCHVILVTGQSLTPRPALRYPNGLALAADGTLYISDIGTNQIFKLAATTLSVVAGTGSGGFGGDGGPAMQAALSAPHALAFDREGRLLVADTYNHRVRRIDRNGVITTIAGTGTAGYAGDGGLATAAALNGPQDVAIDSHGDIFIADTYNATIRRVDAQGVITTFAGSEPGLGGDGGPASKALINIPSAIAIAPDGTLYVSDAGNSRIRRVSTNQTIETVGGAGHGGAGFSGEAGPSSLSKMFSAMGLRFDTAGGLFISDSGNNRVRVVRDGTIVTLAGAGRPGFGGDGGAATTALLNTPQKIAVAPDGRVFVADRGNGRVRMIDSNGTIRTVAGESTPPGILTGTDAGVKLR